MSAPQLASERLERPRSASFPAKSGSQAMCPECGTPYAKLRKHQLFCSTRCRKRSWEKERTVRPAYDIRANIDRLVADVAAIKARLGIEG